MQLVTFRSILVAIALTAGLLAISACSSKQSSAAGNEALAAVAGPHVATVSAVVVSVDPNLDRGRAARYEQENGSTILKKQIEDALSTAGRLDPGGAVLDVKVTGFRLRSTAASVWLGSMAGNDSVEILVTARQGEDAVKSFPLHRSSIMGGLVMPAADVRLRRICAALAEDIVRLL